MASSSLIEPFRVQGRVLLALILREGRTRYGRRKLGYLWGLIEPIIHIVGFTLLFELKLRVIPLGHSVMVFLATGFAMYHGFRHVMTRVQGAFNSNEALLTYPLVRIMDVFIARALLELATWMAVTIIILGTLILLGYGPWPSSIMTMLVAVALMFGIGFGVGVSFGILTQFVPSIEGLTKLPYRVLYFTSAIFYLPDSMPPAIRDVLYWNPLLHGITLLRVGYYPGYESGILDVNYLMSWCIGSVLVAFVAERMTRKSLLSRA